MLHWSGQTGEKAHRHGRELREGHRQLVESQACEAKSSSEVKSFSEARVYQSQENEQTEPEIEHLEQERWSQE
jgi:hypothetical protein